MSSDHLLNSGALDKTFLLTMRALAALVKEGSDSEVDRAALREWLPPASELINTNKIKSKPNRIRSVDPYYYKI